MKRMNGIKEAEREREREESNLGLDLVERY